ncbi:hypothetical protein Zmor_016735 [Zophobas morio]|uniref:Uncharacterized protein n=1 Tax=Zophobas morio TaxID=2755281 RepID=A0AA38MBX2_9CUCU|nr:hypothetical protein Zmor_016735 [Zophobas morio]
MPPFLFLVLFSCVFAASPPCREEFEETICENFAFSPELILASATNKLTIRNAKGPIIHENFSNLTQVTEITFTRSEITNIESGSLCCTPNLTSVTVTDNGKFPKITKKNLQGCQRVKRMSFDGAGIEIEKGAFKETKGLQSLTINGTRMTRLEEGVLAGLEDLKSLTIQHSRIGRVEENAFKELRNLKVLDLQNNKIESVARGAFRNLVQLKVLNLSDNKLKSLTWEEFDGLKGLRVIFLERNDFDSVNVDKLVAGVPDLERIFLSYDKLSPQSRKRVEEVLPKFNITFIYIGKPLE